MRLGIGGVVTFKTAQALRDAVVAVGLEHIILETDCPYLAPVPVSAAATNEPAYIVHTAQALASLCGTSFTQVVNETAETAQALFTG